MHYAQYPALFLAGLILLFMGSQIRAEQKQVYGNYEVHYIALPTTVLSPEIAKAYRLPVSKSAGFVNISVLKVKDDGSKQAVHAYVKGDIRNDVQQVRPLEFQKITEQQSVYAIAPFWYSEGQPYEFRLQIQADPEKGPFNLRFTQTLYPD